VVDQPVRHVVDINPQTNPQTNQLDLGHRQFKPSEPDQAGLARSNHLVVHHDVTVAVLEVNNNLNGQLRHVTEILDALEGDQNQRLHQLYHQQSHQRSHQRNHQRNRQHRHSYKMAYLLKSCVKLFKI